jgi:hypothetical protein
LQPQVDRLARREDRGSEYELALSSISVREIRHGLAGDCRCREELST